MNTMHITVPLTSRTGSTAMLAVCQQPIMLMPFLGEDNDDCQQKDLDNCIHQHCIRLLTLQKDRVLVQKCRLASSVHAASSNSLNRQH